MQFRKLKTGMQGELQWKLLPFKKVSKKAIAKFEAQYLLACEKYFAEQKDPAK